ncbi:peptidase domain protein [Rathayibacter phage NCPPB3778]|nr:peptidase domain protein [Rathayibacter phage NCPPB3778]
MPYNPFLKYGITGTWADHGSYSAGGVDFGMPYGTAFGAPAAGTLRTSGGSGEFAAGYVGSAGRRSILMLDTPLARILPAESYPPEAAGPMVAIVFQHQSSFGAAKHYNEGEICGWSGASANGSDHGGDTHMHSHGLAANGRRVDFTKFITAGGSDPDPGGGGGDPGGGDPGGPGTGSGNIFLETDGRMFKVADGGGNASLDDQGILYITSGGTFGNASLDADGKLSKINDH